MNTFGKNSTKHHHQKKEDFNSHPNMGDITDSNYTYTKNVCKYFKMKNLSEYHGLYVQSDR